ncbi:hypothetical protein LDENG_00003460, partial [Lucifuga dentata]
MDTASLSSSCSAGSVEWPSPFVIPSFSHDVELQLKEADDTYAKDGTLMTMSRSVKSDILDKLADIMSRVTAYPSNDQYESVAKASLSQGARVRCRMIGAEFSRTVTTDLLHSFLDGLDALVPRLLEMFKAAVVSGRKVTLKRVLQCLEKE